LGYANIKAFHAAGVQPPLTEGDLVRVAGALRGSGAAKVTLSLAEGDPAAVTLCELIVSHGGDPRVLNDPGSVAAFTFVQRLARDGLLPRHSFEARYDTEIEYLLTERSFLAQNWSFTSAHLARAGRLDDFAVYSGWSGPKEVHVIGGDVLGIPKGVKGKEYRAAVELAKFLMGKEAQELLVQENSWPSFRSDIDYDKVAPDRRSTFSAIESALGQGWYRPAVRYWQTVSNELNSALTAIVIGGRPVQDVLDEAHERVRDSAELAGVPYP
jgi:trehalose transport system substrate-binding protein